MQLKKFGFDKRKAHLSSLILTDQISREEALSKLKLNPISDEEAKNEFNFVCKKLEISENELTYIMNGENKSFKDYKSSYFLIQFCVKLLRLFKIEEINQMIGIIDYGLGNIKAFYNIYKEKGINLKVISKYTELNNDIKKLILPGIGSYDAAIRLLTEKQFIEPIRILCQFLIIKF